LKEKKETLSRKIKKAQMEERELAMTIARLGSSIDEKQKTIDGHQELLGKLCKDCKPIAESHYKIDILMKEIFQQRADMAVSEAKKNDFAEKISKANEKIDKLDAKYLKLMDQLSSIVEETSSKRLELQRIETNISNLSVNFMDIQDKKNPYDEIIASNKARMEAINKELNEISERYKYLKFAENIVNTDTLKKFIIKDLITLLNAKIKFYLSRLGGNFECIFDENMDVSFVTPGGKCDYANFSSGEQMRLMIASCFAFKDFMQTRNNFYSNILILDEFIDSGIDTLAINGVVKIFEEFKKLDNQSIYVISHRIDDMDSFPFDTVVRISKKDNISSYEVVKLRVQ
jgi:DNA repair exonuclease SbcCD ATPase subunit